VDHLCDYKECHYFKFPAQAVSGCDFSIILFKLLNLYI